MTFLLTTLCDVASIYGPNAPKFGMESWHESIFDAWHMLNGKCLSVHNYDRWEIMSLKSEEDPLAGYNCTEPTILKGYKPDKDKNMVSSDDIKMSGRLIGGCMDCLVLLRKIRSHCVMPKRCHYSLFHSISISAACPGGMIPSACCDRCLSLPAIRHLRKLLCSPVL